MPTMVHRRLRGSGIATSLAAVVLGACLAGCAPSQNPNSGGRETLVFAAASLTDALTEVGEAFTAVGGGPVSFHFAGSNTLAHQIAAGAPADLFLSAGPGPMDLLEGQGAVVPGSVRPLLSNRLVVVVSAESNLGLQRPSDLLTVNRLALADPAAGVPAGVYARQWLEREGLWEELRQRVVPALDVRAALAAVASGNVAAGIVYATDAASSERVRVVYRVPPERAPRIVYELAEVAGGDPPESPARSAFEPFLVGDEAGRIFTRYGFEPVPAPEAVAEP